MVPVPRAHSTAVYQMLHLWALLSQLRRPPDFSGLLRYSAGWRLSLASEQSPDNGTPLDKVGTSFILTCGNNRPAPGRTASSTEPGCGGYLVIWKYHSTTQEGGLTSLAVLCVPTIRMKEAGCLSKVTDCQDLRGNTILQVSWCSWPG